MINASSDGPALLKLITYVPPSINVPVDLVRVTAVYILVDQSAHHGKLVMTEIFNIAH